MIPGGNSILKHGEIRWVKEKQGFRWIFVDGLCTFACFFQEMGSLALDMRCVCGLSLIDS